MTVTRVANFAGADSAANTTISTAYTLLNLTSGNFMQCWVFIGVNQSTSTNPSCSGVSATGGIAFTKKYDSGPIGPLQSTYFNVSMWVAPVGAAAGTKPTVTATIVNAATSAGLAIGIEELHESTGATDLAVDGTPPALATSTTTTVTNGAYTDTTSAGLLQPFYTDWGLNAAVTNSGSGWTTDAHTGNSNAQFVLLSKAAAGGAETAVTWTAPATGNDILAGILSTVAAAAGPVSATATGQTGAATSDIPSAGDASIGPGTNMTVTAYNLG